MSAVEVRAEAPVAVKGAAVSLLIWAGLGAVLAGVLVAPAKTPAQGAYLFLCEGLLLHCLAAYWVISRTEQRQFCDGLMVSLTAAALVLTIWKRPPELSFGSCLQLQHTLLCQAVVACGLLALLRRCCELNVAVLVFVIVEAGLWGFPYFGSPLLKSLPGPWRDQALLWSLRTVPAFVVPGSFFDIHILTGSWLYKRFPIGMEMSLAYSSVAEVVKWHSGAAVLSGFGLWLLPTRPSSEES